MPANGAKPSKLPPNEVLSVITDPMRWRILECLGEDKTAKQVGEALGIKAMLGQYHCKELVKAGILDEFPLPGYQRRFVYSLRAMEATITIKRGQVKAVVKILPAEH